MAWNTLPYENNGYLGLHLDRANPYISWDVTDWKRSTGFENPDHPKVTEYINSQPGISQQCKDSMMAAWKGWGRTKYYVEQYGCRTVDELAEEFILFMSKPRSIPSIPKPFAGMQAKIDEAWASLHDGMDIVKPGEFSRR